MIHFAIIMIIAIIIMGHRQSNQIDHCLKDIINKFYILI